LFYVCVSHAPTYVRKLASFRTRYAIYTHVSIYLSIHTYIFHMKIHHKLNQDLLQLQSCQRMYA
jgi:hypothetical protein